MVDDYVFHDLAGVCPVYLRDTCTSGGLGRFFFLLEDSGYERNNSFEKISPLVNGVSRSKFAKLLLTARRCRKLRREFERF